ncbi:MAG: ATP-binding cassette domain-containing protein [Proteobacteria bacterium]|nr:ATP-binding cassette domain-containing protein [Pseudomonadota bacterium]
MSAETATASDGLVVTDWNVWRGSHWIVRSVTLSLPMGSLLVVAGRNGSGKSTFLRSVAGLLSSREGWRYSGDCALCGHSQAKYNTAAFMGQNLGTSDELTVGGFLKLQGSASGKAQQHLIGRLELQSLMSVRLSELSGGEWQRVRLARCLMKDSRVLLLDEPDAALDDSWRTVLWDLLAARRSLGHLIVVVLHRPLEALGAATHWAGFERGQLMFCESDRRVFPEALMNRLFLGKTLDSSECVV